MKSCTSGTTLHGILERPIATMQLRRVNDLMLQCSAACSSWRLGGEGDVSARGARVIFHDHG